MSSGYRSFRLLLVNLSYFYALELLLTNDFRPGVPQAIEYLTWVGCGIAIFFLAWLITNNHRAEASAGLWLIALFAALWLDWHRQQMTGFGLKKLGLILGPCLLFLIGFTLWLMRVTWERFHNLKNEMMIASLAVFPPMLLLYRQSFSHPFFDLGFAFGPAVFFAMAIGSILIAGLVLAQLSSLRIFPLSKLWMVLVLPMAAFALLGPVQSEMNQQRALSPTGKNLPDLILITVDTLRQDHLGVYSQGKYQTPNFDRLAQDSVIFDNAVSASNWTLPSIASWLTGQYPHQHQAGQLIYDASGSQTGFTGINQNLPTLAERLRKQGYFTAAFVDNVWLKEFGIPRGFDYFFLFYPPQLDRDLMGLKLVKAAYYLLNGRYQDSGGAWLTDRAIAWLQNNPHKKPIFLWVHYFDPHLPYRGHREYPVTVKANPAAVKAVNRSSPEFIRAGFNNLSGQDKIFIHQRYIGEVVYTDLHFGRLIKSLRDQGRYLDSAIIFSADHGEEFWEHNGFDHGHTFYQELIKVPLFVKFPQNQKAGQRVPTLVSSAQIYSTFLDFGGLKPENLPGLNRVIEDPMKSPELVLSEFTFYFDWKGAIIGRDLQKVILASGKDKMFFDLASDPEEKNPLPPEVMPPALLNLELPSPGPDLEKAAISPETRRSLEALGYLK